MEPHPILKEGKAPITYSIHHTFISNLSMCNVKRIGKKGEWKKKGIGLIGRRKREVEIK
jgi:hypothetical protein